MREHPIIFGSDMVKAILDGIKTQTRRVIKFKNYHRNVWDYCVPHNGERAELLGEPYLKVPYDAITDNAGTRITCPYGQVGDRLWVRETHFIGGIEPDEWAWYKAGFDGNAEAVLWRPSIHMPRWASRITLEITEVRVERLQEIRDTDVDREGVAQINIINAIPEFRKLWDSLNAKRGYGWEVNPWVWVISFKDIL